MFRNNGGLFLLGFAFVVLCMIGVWAIRYSGPKLDAVARGDATPAAAPAAPARGPSNLPMAGRPINVPVRGINFIGRDMSPEPGSGLEQAIKTAVRAGDDAPRGLIDGEHIRTAIAAVEPLWTECFLDAKERYQGPQRATLKFVLKGQGEAGRFEGGELIQTSVDDPWVRSCLVESLIDAKYTAPADAAELVVSYPFYFPGE